MKTMQQLSMPAGLMMVCAVAVSPAMAADSFAGPGIAVAAGQKSTTMNDTVTAGGVAASAYTGDTSVFGQISGEYTFSVGANVRLGAGVFLDVGDGKAGSATFTAGGATATASFKETRRYGVAVEPGIALGDNALVYMKLTYNRARGEASSTAGSGSETFAGFGYGLGLKHMVNTSVFVYAEWQQVNYERKTYAYSGGASETIKPKTTLGLFGVGTKF